MTAAKRPTLLVVVGPTGSGKSDLAHAVALARRGEIVSADAFAVYRGFDVGTDKPSAAKRREIPYHLVDVADPDETFSAGRWRDAARRAVEEIVARGKLPIVCGGSGFYVQAVLEGLPPGEAASPELRTALVRWGRRDPEGARRLLERNDPPAAARIARENLRYVLRALEIVLTTGRPASARLAFDDAWSRDYRVVRIGIRRERADLYARIAARVREMLQAGWESEVRRLLAEGVSPDANAFGAIGYRELAHAAAASGLPDFPSTEKEIVSATRRLAKRQATWFRRDRAIVWVPPETALPAALELLDAGDKTE